MGHLSFVSLKKEHFPLLLKWLKATHVSCWYDKDTNWTTGKIQEKYTSYTEGFKLSDGVRKGLFAFVIAYDETPIGYIQYYDAYDFPRDGYALRDLPTSLAALDMLIGEEAYLGKGIGQKALALFLESHVHTQFDYVFVDPDRKNSAAIKIDLFRNPSHGEKIFRQRRLKNPSVHEVHEDFEGGGNAKISRKTQLRKGSNIFFFIISNMRLTIQ